MQPNILMIGYKTQWMETLQQCPEELEDYLSVIKYSGSLRYVRHL